MIANQLKVIRELITSVSTIAQGKISTITCQQNEFVTFGVSHMLRLATVGIPT